MASKIAAAEAAPTGMRQDAVVAVMPECLWEGNRHSNRTFAPRTAAAHGQLPLRTTIADICPRLGYRFSVMG